MISQIFSPLFILIILCLKNQVLSTPVIIWSNVKLTGRPVSLSAISPHHFISNYICDSSHKRYKLRLIAVEDLSIEDIQRGVESNHPLLVNAKKDNKKFLYYPNVANDVYKTFSLLPQSNNMKCSFEITSSKVYESLHDALNIMQDTIDSTAPDATNAVVIALINGPIKERQRRATARDQSNILVSNNKTCLFHADKLYWNSANGEMSTARIYNFDAAGSSCIPNATSDSNNTVIFNLVWKNGNSTTDVVNMKLTASIIGRYWYLKQATLNNNLYRYFAYGMHSEMDTPPAYSYVCTTATFVRYDNADRGRYNYTDKFYIKDLQMQPFYGKNLFGQPNYCTSFFTSGIWMGITSSLLCLVILLVGVHRLMTIKSNDRFDDPKGKPLVIKAQE